MIRTSLAVAGLAALVALQPAPASAAANLLINGSFESYAGGVFTGWTNGGSMGTTPSQYATPHPTNGVTPGPFGDVVAPDPFTASPDAAGVQGAYFVADNAMPFQSLYQTVSGLIAGQTYQVGFDLFPTLTGAANPGFFTLSGMYGGLLVTTANAGTTTPGAWQHYEANFVATTTSDTFTFAFTSGDTPSKDVIADLVYLTAVPEPASLAVLGVGLLGLGLARRRKEATGA